MPDLTLSGPKEEVVELLEELVGKIRDDEDDPSIAIMPNGDGGALYISYDGGDADEGDGVMFELAD